MLRQGKRQGSRNSRPQALGPLKKDIPGKAEAESREKKEMTREDVDERDTELCQDNKVDKSYNRSHRVLNKTKNIVNLF